MSGPASPVVDNFNRADQNPLASGWSALQVKGGAGNLQVLANQLAAIAAAYGEAMAPGTYGPDCEVFCTMAAFSGGWDLSLRVTNPGTPQACGYIVEAGSGSQQIYRLDNGTPNPLGAGFGGATIAGDKFLFRAIGSRLEVWRFTGGNWVLQGSRTDSTYKSAGKVAVALWNATGRIDDVGAGTMANKGGSSQNADGAKLSVPVGSAIAPFKWQDGMLVDANGMMITTTTVAGTRWRGGYLKDAQGALLVATPGTPPYKWRDGEYLDANNAVVVTPWPGTNQRMRQGSLRVPAGDLVVVV
jgi:hypothetical protein